MIENELQYQTTLSKLKDSELQYQTTLSKLKDFEQQLAALDPQDPNLHPRQIIGWRNSFNLTIRQLKQEI
jgi:nitrate reductase alpha subunit